jgi:hypothetical protein
MAIKRLIVFLALIAGPIFAQQGSPAFSYVGAYAGAPTACAQYSLGFMTDKTAGQNLYVCFNSAWTQIGTGGGTVTNFSAGNLSPLFTTSVATGTTTPALSFSLATGQTANEVFGTNGSGAVGLYSPSGISGIGNVTTSGTNTTGHLATWSSNTGITDGGSSPDCLGGLVAGSSSAAAANLALINASLAQPGTTYICGANGPVYWVSGALISYSNTKLKFDPGVVVKLTASTNSNLWVNYNETQPFLTSTGCTWTSGTTCTLNFPSHGFPVGSGAAYGGQWVWAQGSENYIVSGTSAITYSSGASGCTNGTQNVTLTNTAGAVFTNIGTITVSGGVPTGAITFTSTAGTWGFGTNPITAAVATCTGTVLFATGGGSIASTDTAYSGIFRVASVPDANNLVVQLNRLPTTGASSAGPFYVKYTDSNIQAENLTLDFNSNVGSGSNTGGGTNITSLAVALAGIEQFNYSGTYKTLNYPNSSPSFAFGCYGIDNFYMSGFIEGYAGNGAKESIQCYGPLTHFAIRNTTGWNGDDLVALIIGSGGWVYAYENYNYMGGGDVLHGTVDGVSGYSGAHCEILYGDSGAGYADDLVFSRSSCAGTATAHVSLSGGSMGTITIDKTSCQDDTTTPCIYLTGNSIASLQIRNTAGPQYRNTNSVNLIGFGAGETINQLIVDGVTMEPGTSGDTILAVPASETIGAVDVSHISVPTGQTFSTSTTALITNATANATTWNLHDNYVSYDGSLWRTSTSGQIVSAKNNYYNNGEGTITGMLQANAATTFQVGNNNVPNGWLFGLGGSSVAYTIYDTGGNLTNHTLTRYIGVLSGGTPLATIYGGCNDAYVDIALSSIVQAAGSCVANWNSASGLVGPLISNGTYYVPTTGAYQGTTASIGGGALTAACATGTVSITGVTTAMAATATPLTSGAPYNSGAFAGTVSAQVTSAGTATVSVCGTGTPTSSTYLVKVN